MFASSLLPALNMRYSELGEPLESLIFERVLIEATWLLKLSIDSSDFFSGSNLETRRNVSSLPVIRTRVPELLMQKPHAAKISLP